MMYLTPLRYGGTVAPPPDPTGNVWMAVDSNIGNVYIGEYDGSNWTLQSNDYSGVMGGPHLRVGSTLYLGETIQYCDVSDVSDWTTLGGSDNNNIRQIVTDGTYGYATKGFASLLRWTLPYGSSTIPLATSESWCDTATVWGGDLYIFSTIDNRCKVSTDNGASYTDKTEYRTSGTSVGTPKAASNDDIIVVAYSDNNGVGPVKVAYSTDGATTWTTVTPPITADSDPDVADLVWTGSEFILGTNTGTNVGRIAYSADGITWSAGTTVKDIAFFAVGIDKVAVATTEINIYETTDGGATWTEMPEIVSSVNTGHTAYIYWIGDPP
jgi:hypothetical protein